MQTDKSAMKGGSGKAAEESAKAGLQNEAVKVTAPQFHERQANTVRAPQAPKQQDVEVTLYEQHLTMDAAPKVHEIGKAQIRTSVTHEKESLSVPVLREHVTVSHEPIDRSQWVEGATVRLTDQVQEITLHGTDVEGSVHRETVPYERVRLSVTPEVRTVNVEADCARQSCEVVEPQVAEGDMKLQVSDTAYGVREARAEARAAGGQSERQFATAAEFSAAEDEGERDAKGRFKS